MTPRPLRIVVVDDSLLYRMTVRKALVALKNVEVVASAADGASALDLVDQHDPDLLTLDVQMPGIDGIEVLRQLKRRGSRTKAVMLSSLTASGTQATTDSLIEGAFDFILKPADSDAEKNFVLLRSSLCDKISAFRASRQEPPDDTASPAPTARVDFGEFSCRLVVIGTSTGGPEALRFLLPQLTESLRVPVIVVQHMPAGYTASLAARMNELCPLTVAEGDDATELLGGSIVVAPGGKQTKLKERGSKLLVATADDPPELGCRPSINYLLRSLSPKTAARTLAVILTGMGEDGTDGCRAIKDHGGVVIAQDRASSTVYGMPGSVFRAGLVDICRPLDSIAGTILGITKSR